MSDERDDERPDDRDEEHAEESADESPDESADESADDSADESPDDSPDESADEALDDDESFGDELSASESSEPKGPSGPAVMDLSDLDALDDSGMDIEVEGMEPEEEPDDELAVDLSDFDAEAGGGRVQEAELEAAREQAEELRREKQEAKAELAALRDQVRRTAADFENYRKRIERDRKEEKKQAAAGLVLKLLAVTDSFQRALEQGAAASEENEAVAGFVEGVRLIETQFFDILRAAGLEPVDSEGAFDPAVHEALMQEPTSEAPHLSILEVFEKGYLFGGRLLRPARVKVAHNPDGVAAEAEEVEDSAADADEGNEAGAGGAAEDQEDQGAAEADDPESPKDAE